LEVGNAGPIEKESLVEFHLLYQGPLHSQGSETAHKEKHQIRKNFHQQLKRLWFTNPNLRRMARMIGGPVYFNDWGETDSGSPPEIPEDEQWRWGIEHLSKTWDICGFNFLPLVTADLFLRCQLEILFLRMEEKDWVVQGGDIDRRIHVLFDGLRKFRDCNDKPPQAHPEPEENPLFCLLEDDQLISDVRINTGRLLLLPTHKEPDQHDVYLQITVRLNPVQRSQFSWVFE
jgi:hypothetical protein